MSFERPTGKFRDNESKHTFEPVIAAQRVSKAPGRTTQSGKLSTSQLLGTRRYSTKHIQRRNLSRCVVAVSSKTGPTSRCVPTWTTAPCCVPVPTKLAPRPRRITKLSEGVSATAKSGLKRAGKVISTETAARARRELRTLAVARRELLVRWQLLLADERLSLGVRAKPSKCPQRAARSPETRRSCRRATRQARHPCAQVRSTDAKQSAVQVALRGCRRIAETERRIAAFLETR